MTTRVVFAGTPPFALASLRALVESACRPVAVLTQPDRPAGRGRKLTASVVKKYALDRNLKVLQPASLKSDSVVEELRALQADLFIVAAYGLLLPPAVLEIPRSVCINVHASLLPRWRGAAPVQAAILAGDARTGISLMQMDAGMDTGPVYAESAVAIDARETAGELLDKLAVKGGELLVQHLTKIAAGNIAPVPQDESLVTHAARIRTADARLDWSRAAPELQRAVQAYNPVPGAWTTCDGERLKCWSALALETNAPGLLPGSVLTVSEAGIEVSCGEGRLLLTEVQRPGRRRISGLQLSRQLDLDRATLGSQD